MNNRMNQWFIHIFFIFIFLASILPFLLMIMASITDENTIVAEGYSFWPSNFSFEAYNYLFTASDTIVRSYVITIFVTIVGTAVGLFMTALFAYPLSRRDLPLRNLIAFLLFFTLLFNGGLVSTYLVYTEILHLKNTIWALIIPGLLFNGFSVIIIRTFYNTTIPETVLESAYLDGASELTTFFRIVVPLSLPIFATMGLLQTILYWNDWNNGLLYLTDSNLFNIQNLLNRMLSDMQALQRNPSLGAKVTVQVPTSSVRMAMAVVGILPILLAYPFFQKYLVKGLTIGAVK